MGVLCQEAVWRGIGAFHLAENNPFISERLLRFLQFKMPPLLLENKRRQSGIKDGVQIDVNKIVEVLYVLAGHRIAGFVGIGHGIEKGLHRALQKLYKRFLDRVFSRPTEYGVFQNMGHAR